MELGLKDTILELRDIVFKNKSRQKIEGLVDELSNKTPLESDVLLEFYNIILMWKIQSESIKRTKRRTWTGAEEAFLFFYVEIQCELEGTSNSQIFDEVSEILDRTKEAVSYKYYNPTINKKINDEEDTDNQQQLDIDDIKDEDLPIGENLSDTNKEVVEYKPKEEFDLLNGLGQLVSNVSTVGLNISPFFEGLLQMSKKAVENSNVEVVKELNEKLSKERLDNDILQTEFKKVYSNFVQLKKEVQYFNDLSSVEKLQQINSHNQKLNLIIESFEQSFAISISV